MDRPLTGSLGRSSVVGNLVQAGVSERLEFDLTPMSLPLVKELSSSEEGDAASERILCAKLRRKDRAAFEELVKCYQAQVFNFCVRMLSDREEACDLVQEIFLAVHQNFDRFRMESKLSTWVLRVAHNHCLNRLKYLRRRGSGRSEPLEEVGESALAEVAESPQSPDELLSARGEQARVQRAIARLDDHQRTLVVLRDIEGLSYEEIVGVTGVAEGTVKSRIHRAREKLGQLLLNAEER